MVGMLTADQEKYGPEISSLLMPDRYVTLSLSIRNEAVQYLLDSLRDEDITAGQPLRNPDMAALCRGALMLYHDFLEAADRIFGEVDDPAGALWRGILLRRDEDYSGSKACFEQACAHPVFGPLQEAASEEIGPNPPAALAELVNRSEWSPSLFVDLVEKCEKGKLDNGAEDILIAIMRREWELLFDYCHTEAAGY
jgi:hypothetical protein